MAELIKPNRFSEQISYQLSRKKWLPTTTELETFGVNSKTKMHELEPFRARAIREAGGWALFKKGSQKKQKQVSEQQEAMMNIALGEASKQSFFWGWWWMMRPGFLPKIVALAVDFQYALRNRTLQGPGY